MSNLVSIYILYSTYHCPSSYAEGKLVYMQILAMDIINETLRRDSRHLWQKAVFVFLYGHSNKIRMNINI